jgi:hypothetical protein
LALIRGLKMFAEKAKTSLLMDQMGDRKIFRGEDSFWGIMPQKPRSERKHW